MKKIEERVEKEKTMTTKGKITTPLPRNMAGSSILMAHGV